MWESMSSPFFLKTLHQQMKGFFVLKRFVPVYGNLADHPVASLIRFPWGVDFLLKKNVLPMRGFFVWEGAGNGMKANCALNPFRF